MIWRAIGYLFIFYLVGCALYGCHNVIYDFVHPACTAWGC